MQDIYLVPARPIVNWAPANTVTSFGIIPEHYTREQVDKINSSVNNRGIYKWTPSERYTRDQVTTINDAIEAGLFNFKDTSDYSGRNIKSWVPSKHYTREQVDAKQFQSYEYF